MTAACDRTFHIDCHAHLHPSYDVALWVESALSNLRRGAGAGDSVFAAVIAVDRPGPTASEVLSIAQRDGKCSVEGVLADGSLMVTPRSGPQQGASLLVIPGTQNVAKEGIEVLGLGASSRPAPGGYAADQVTQILEEGGIPCIPWSPGKWLGRRGRVVMALFDMFGPHQLAVGDISIRSKWGPPSSLLTHARSSGFPLLMGSDPLPFPGEERLVGSLGTVVRGAPVSANGVVAWLLERLRDPSKIAGYCGEKNPPLLAVRRLFASNLRRI